LAAQLIQVFLDNIAPILLVAAVGFLLGRHYRLEPRPVSALIFNAFSPALVFRSLAFSNIEGSEFGRLLLAVVLLVISLTLLAYFVSRWHHLSRIQSAGVILSAICPNNGNLGLPLIDFAFGPAVLARAVIVFVTITIMNYTLGVYIASSGRSSPRQAIQAVLRMPIIYAVLAGIAVNATGWEMPISVGRVVELLAQAAVPSMLMLLGLQLAQSNGFLKPQLVVVGAALRLLLSPLVAIGVSSILFGLEGPASTAFIMQASMPVAVVTIIFASEFNLNREQILSTILVTTVLSPFTLSVLIVLLTGST